MWHMHGSRVPGRWDFLSSWRVAWKGVFISGNIQMTIPQSFGRCLAVLLQADANGPAEKAGSTRVIRIFQGMWQHKLHDSRVGVPECQWHNHNIQLNKGILIVCIQSKTDRRQDTLLTWSGNQSYSRVQQMICTGDSRGYIPRTDCPRSFSETTSTGNIIFSSQEIVGVHS